MVRNGDAGPRYLHTFLELRKTLGGSRMKRQAWLTGVCEVLVGDFPLACRYGIVKYIYLFSIQPSRPLCSPKSSELAHCLNQ